MSVFLKSGSHSLGSTTTVPATPWRRGQGNATPQITTCARVSDNAINLHIKKKSKRVQHNYVGDIIIKSLQYTTRAMRRRHPTSPTRCSEAITSRTAVATAQQRWPPPTPAQPPLSCRSPAAVASVPPEPSCSRGCYSLCLGRPRPRVRLAPALPVRCQGGS